MRGREGGREGGRDWKGWAGTLLSMPNVSNSNSTRNERGIYKINQLFSFTTFN